MNAVLRYVLGVLAFALGAYMVVDGLHAFLHGGQFITPATGPYAGQLGPWAALLHAAGIDPLSPFVRTAFVVLGFAWVVHSFFVGLDRRSKRVTMVLAVLTLWYLPAGTIVGILELVAVLVRKPERAT